MIKNKQTSRIGLQSSAEELMKTIPFLETVAGDALSILCTCIKVQLKTGLLSKTI